MAQVSSADASMPRRQSASLPAHSMDQPSRPDFETWAVAVREQMLAVLAKSNAN